MDKFNAFGKSFGKNVAASFNNLNANLNVMSKIAQLKEIVGVSKEQTELPPDYLDLEKRIDALKAVHVKLLKSTEQYATVPYDYPANIQESFGDIGRTVSEKVTMLAHAQSTSEAASAVLAAPSTSIQPKTFAHAISRSAMSSSQILRSVSSAKEDVALADALEKYAISQEKVGEARLIQDETIQGRFLAGWNATLNTSIPIATKARRKVEQSRLELDAYISHLASGGAFSFQNQAPELDREHLSDEDKNELLKREEALLGETDNAEVIMKDVLITPDPLRHITDLIAAQVQYHKKAFEILSEVAPVIEKLHVDQEASYRSIRGAVGS